MSARKKSVDSFDEFFATKKSDNDNDDRIAKDDDIPTSSAISNLIKTQPVIHHPRTASDTKSNANSESPLLKKVVNNVPSTSPTKSKPIDTPQSKAYEFDFDDDKDHENINSSPDNKIKPNLIPIVKPHSPVAPHPVENSKVKRSQTITNPPPPPPPAPNNNNNLRRKERFLPYVRPPKRRDGVKKRYVKDTRTEVEKRLLSAQNVKMNQLKSYLYEIAQQLEEERTENRTLRLLQQREEKALQRCVDEQNGMVNIARQYADELENVKKTITEEREQKLKLEEDLEKRDRVLREQNKKIRFFEKLEQQIDLEESEELREKLKQSEKKLKKVQDKIIDHEKEIEKIEKIHRQEIHQELLKQRDLKLEIEHEIKKYSDLLSKVENQTKRIDTMHIYIQRGGRRPSRSSVNLSKSLSYPSIQDTSPRFREKVLDYDKKRREQEKQEQKLRPKPKPLLLPIRNPPPKRERKKYVPKLLEPKIPPKKPSPPLSHIVDITKPSTIEHAPKIQHQVHRLSISNSPDEEKSELDEETLNDFIKLKPPSAPSKGIQRREQHISQALIRKRSLTPIASPYSSLGHDKSTTATTTSSVLKHTESLPLGKPKVTRELDDKWNNLFDADKKDSSTKDDLLSKLLSDEQEEIALPTIAKPTPSSSQRTSIIMFDPTSGSTNGHQKKPSTHIKSTELFDFDEPAVTPPVTQKTSMNTFEALFNNNPIKPTSRINGRDDTFTTTADKTDPFDLPFGGSTSATNISAIPKSNQKPYLPQNDKLQRPKVVTNTSKPVPNWTASEEIEELVL